MADPVPLPLNDANMLRIIRELAQDTGNVFIEPHAHENIRGNWKCTLRHHHAGDLVRVTAAIEKDDSGGWIAVVTVF